MVSWTSQRKVQRHKIKKEMFQDVIQIIMEDEMGEELRRERFERANEPNGTSSKLPQRLYEKSVKTQLGEVGINVPQARNGSFAPKIIEKYN